MKHDCLELLKCYLETESEYLIILKIIETVCVKDTIDEYNFVNLLFF